MRWSTFLNWVGGMMMGVGLWIIFTEGVSALSVALTIIGFLVGGIGDVFYEVEMDD